MHVNLPRVKSLALSGRTRGPRVVVNDPNSPVPSGPAQQILPVGAHLSDDDVELNGFVAFW